MGFIDSVSPDITESLPAGLGGGVVDAPPSDPSAWDVTIGTLGFNLAPNAQAPYQRGTEQTRKQQIDVSPTAGENSFSSWWMRTQSSWDKGAGVRWFDPRVDELTVDRFANSQGVDVWTPGQVTLLPAMTVDDMPWKTFSLNMYRGDDPGILDVALFLDPESPAMIAQWGSFDETDTTGGMFRLEDAVDLTRPAVAGGTAAIGVVGVIVKVTPHSGTGITTLTPSVTCTGLPQVWYAKARLIVALGPVLYELPLSATGDLATVGTVITTHPDPNWRWVDVGETGSAILAAGTSGFMSNIFRITAEEDPSGLPTLTGASIVASFPDGERISCMGVYLGAHVVVGTTRGVRVGVVNDQGEVQYGPWTVELAEPPAGILFDDRFAYVGVNRALPDGSTGMVRIDLSAPIEDSGRYAWAWDQSTGKTASILSFSGCDRPDIRVWVLCLEGFECVTSPNYLVSSGWLDTGRIRYATSDLKAFRYAKMVCSTNGGHVSLSAINPEGVENRVVDFDDSYTTSDDVAITMPGSLVHQWLSFKVTLTPTTVSGGFDAESPVLSGLTVKAVPAPTRVRLYQFPLLIQDFEEHRFGNVTGGCNDGFRRLAELERLEESGEPVPIRDNRTGEAFIGQVDSVDFTGIDPPDGPASGFGGLAVTQVRRL